MSMALVMGRRRGEERLEGALNNPEETSSQDVDFGRF
jgi:hypothetical protein